MRNKSQESENKLFKIAESQQGYFTSKQAKVSGYKDNTHPYHVQSGHWIRVHRGIYRLAKFPESKRPDLMIWALWSCNRSGKIEGVYSHQTALSIHELSDILPDRLHMTVPLSFRRNSAIPKILVIHRKQLSQDQIVSMDGYFVTTPYQTLLDVITEAYISHELILQAVQAASDRGVITQTMLKRLLSEQSVQSSPIYSLLKGFHENI
ncbi:MAG: type IV toxin-antitoxin system AbiEi family antitoxin domain-containing protein [Chlamydiales bacterium]|nr:type IV toxin-antitoxin system AbiEi family antitoxin domain-containing protein [Chlamydiales bacterium]